jgi:hypothetical protein
MSSQALMIAKGSQQFFLNGRTEPCLLRLKGEHNTTAIGLNLIMLKPKREYFVWACMSLAKIITANNIKSSLFLSIYISKDWNGKLTMKNYRQLSCILSLA